MFDLIKRENEGSSDINISLTKPFIIEDDIVDPFCNK